MSGMNAVVSVSGATETAMICGLLRGRGGISVVSVDDPIEADRTVRSSCVDVLIFSVDNERSATLVSAQVPYRVMIVRDHIRDLIRDAEAACVFDIIVRPISAERLTWSIDEMIRRRSAIAALNTPISQTTLDHAFGRRVARFEEGSDIANNEAMLDAVISVIESSEDGASASQVGDALKISRVTARRYCEALANMGALRVKNLYQIKGRPIKLYVRIR